MWVLIVIMLQGRQFEWPERFATQAACERQRDEIVGGQAEVAVIESARCAMESTGA